jgi:hypothetical protein
MPLAVVANVADDPLSEIQEIRENSLPLPDQGLRFP